MNPKAPQFETLISEKEIARGISELSSCLNEEYFSSSLVLIAVLKGAVPFLCDLMRQLDCDVEIGFLQASSYGERGTQRGDLTLTTPSPLNLKGKDVLILDDIFDSGSTLSAIVSELKKYHPNTLKTAVLLSKKVPRKTDLIPDYTLFEIDDHFVIGYGLDYKEKYRNLPAIYKLGIAKQ